MILPEIIPLKTIYVDDDPDELAFTATMVANNTAIDYLGGFLSAEEALDFLNVTEIDLIFIDVEMPGKDGLWLSQQIQDLGIAIIFLTSHTGYAMQAFKAYALDYILKPISEARLFVILEKVRHEKQKDLTLNTDQIETFDKQLNQKVKPTRIFLNMVSSISVIKLENVLYFSSSHNYTLLVLNNGSRQTVSKTIKVYEDILKENGDFLRVSRFFVVNKNYIQGIKRNTKNRQFALIMENGDILETSFKNKDEILEKLA